MENSERIDCLLTWNFALRRSVGVRLETNSAFVNFMSTSRLRRDANCGGNVDDDLLHLLGIFMNETLARNGKPIVQRPEWRLTPALNTGFINMGTTFKDEFPSLNLLVRNGLTRIWSTGDVSSLDVPLLKKGQPGQNRISVSRRSNVVQVTASTAGNAPCEVFSFIGMMGRFVIRRMRGFFEFNPDPADEEDMMSYVDSEDVECLTYVNADGVNQGIRNNDIYNFSGGRLMLAAGQRNVSFSIELFLQSISEEVSILSPWPVCLSDFACIPERMPVKLDAMWNVFKLNWGTFPLGMNEVEMSQLVRLINCVSAMLE